MSSLELVGKQFHSDDGTFDASQQEAISEDALSSVSVTHAQETTSIQDPFDDNIVSQGRDERPSIGSMNDTQRSEYDDADLAEKRRRFYRQGTISDMSPEGPQASKSGKRVARSGILLLLFSISFVGSYDCERESGRK